jgi:N-acetylglutamate synthase-like GNAT family acetyltransferase
MRPVPLVRRATREDAIAIAPLVRHADARDVMVALHGSVERAVMVSFERSIAAWTWIHEGKPGLMIGVTSMSLVGGERTVWLFTTDAVEKNPRTFYVGSKKMLQFLLAEFGTIQGYCDARFTQSVAVAA